jgi:hypothetical protein
MNTNVRLLALLALVASQTNNATTLIGTSFLSPRSQSTNAARTLIGEHRFEHTCDVLSGVFSPTVEYTRSYRPRRLGEYFFGDNILCITGSAITDRSENQILADYFGLSPAFSSIVHVEPVWSNGLIDFSFFSSYNHWYFTAHAPVVWNHARIDLDEIIIREGIDTPFPAGYMDAGVVPPAYRSFKEAIASGKTFGDVQPLLFGKIPPHHLAETKLSDIQFSIGYDVVNRERGYAGFNARFTIPTGTKPTSEYLLAPIVGNGHHWELGVGFEGRGLVWERNEIQYTYIYLVMNIMHLFKARQLRSFDFYSNSANTVASCPQSGFGSRYILAKEFNENGTYTGITVPAINVSSFCCNVSNSLQCDLVLMIAYQHCGFGFDLGYNFYVRSKEKIELNKSQFPENRYAFKGIQNVTGFNTQSNATLDGNVLQIAIAEHESGPLTFPEQQTLLADSNPPVFIQANDIDVDSAANPMILTHKIFWYLYYTCEPTCCGHVTPYYGLGGEMEFEGDRQLYCQPNKNAMSQWGLWAKGGFAWH